MNPAVSVIVPIYNVSRFLGKCAESLLSQTFSNYEVIFVDDASPDNSMDVLEAIIKKHADKDVTVLHHPENLGLPSARNTGMEAASGDYILHVDGDDWIEPDMIENLYSSIISTNADMAYCDFFLTYEDYERKMINPSFNSADHLLKRGFLAGTMKYNVWNKLVRRSIYTENKISFPDSHAMGEDMTMIMVAACCEKVVHVAKPLYHYVKTNAQAYSQTISCKSLSDTKFNVDRVESFLNDHYGNKLEQELNWFKLSIKLPFLITSDKSQHEIWKEWYPEANVDATSNKDLPVRTRLLQWLAAHKMFALVSLYYFIAYKVIYRIIYR